MFRKSIALLVALMMMVSLMACGGTKPLPSTESTESTESSASSASSVSSESSKQVEIRVAWWGGQSRNEKTNKMMDAFEKEYQNIKIIREANTATDFREKVTIQIAGGNAPDVFQASSFVLDDFIERKAFRELDDLVAAKTIDLSDFNQVDIDAGKKDGKQYLILWGHIITGIVYNQTMFEDAGVALPKNNWSWNDYVETCAQLQAKLGTDKWASEDEGGSYRNVEAYAVQKGKALFNGNEIGLSKEELIAWYSMWSDMRKLGVVPTADIQSEQGNQDLEKSMFGRGKVAMFSTSSNQLSGFQNLTKDKIGIVSYPWIEGAVKKTPMIASGVGIYEKSKHVQESATLINWLVNSENATKIYLGENGEPTSNKMKVIMSSLATPSQKTEYEFLNIMTDAISAYPAQPAGANSVKSLLITANEAIGFGKMTVEEAVTDFIKQSNQIIKR